MMRIAFTTAVVIFFSLPLLAIVTLKEQPQQQQECLMNPSLANQQAPAQFKVNCVTTKGNFVIEVTRDWAPHGADRFYNLVKCGFFQDIAIFRAIDGFMFQFGIHGDPTISKIWREQTIKDDLPKQQISNTFGYISFAMAGPNTRTTQLFVNLGNNSRLDGMGFTPFAKVVEGSDILKKIQTKYGENSREVQGRFQEGGNEYIKKRYPDIDFITSMTLVDGSATP